MSEFKVDAITNRNGSHGPQICGITTFGGSGVTIPSGGLSGARGRGFLQEGKLQALLILCCQRVLR